MALGKTGLPRFAKPVLSAAVRLLLFCSENMVCTVCAVVMQGTMLGFNWHKNYFVLTKVRSLLAPVLKPVLSELARAQLLSMLLWCMQGHSRQIVKCVVDCIKRRPVRLA